MDLLAAYQNELLALLAIIIILSVYIFIKKNQKPKINEKELESLLAEKKSKKNAFETKKELKEIIPKQAKMLELDGKEEGEFYSKELQKHKEQTVIKKRDVPPHEKITKENFKEFAGQRILIAEDNIINQKVILGLLADSGIDVVVANDGLEALEILQKDSDFTLILMDAHMPRMDGFEATRRIRANPDYEHIAIIALSGDTAADDIRKMIEAGMNEHLEKPLRVDALYDILYAYSLNKNEHKTIFKELNINKGIEIAGDDKEFYSEILNEFLNSYETSHKTIKEYLEQNDIKTVDKLLLDIIGVSANIGATNLNRTALNLKSSLNNYNNDSSRLFIDFEENLKKLIKEIKIYRTQNN